MQIRFRKFNRYIIPAVAVLMLPMICTRAFAASPTASGSLTVTATVNSSLTLSFATASGGVTLTGAGTNTATLAFGAISAYGTEPANVTVTNSGSLCSSCFIAQTPVSIAVVQADGSSSTFTLTAQLGTSDAYSWGVGSSAALNNTTPTTISAAGTYGAGGNTFPILLGVPTSTANSTNISNTINFVATAN